MCVSVQADTGWTGTVDKVCKSVTYCSFVPLQELNYSNGCPRERNCSALVSFGVCASLHMCVRVCVSVFVISFDCIFSFDCRSHCVM